MQNASVPASDRVRTFLVSAEGRFVLLCTLAALVVRLFFVRYQYVINTDGVYYVTLGRRLISGDLAGGVSPYWSPLYPFLVGVASLFVSDLEFAGRLVSVLAGALLVPPLYVLIRGFYGRTAARLGAVIAVIYPGLIQYSTLVMTESTYTLAFTCALVVGWNALKGHSRAPWVWTGLLLGCCYLLKPEAIAYTGLFVLLALSSALFERQRRLRDAAFNAIVLLAGFVVLFLPYFLSVHQRTGRWIISEKIVNNVGGTGNAFRLSSDGQTTLTDRLYGTSAGVATPPTPSSSPRASTAVAIDRLAGLRARLVRSYRNLKVEIKEMIPEIFPYSLIVLCIVGFFRTAWTRERAQAHLFQALFVGVTLIGYAVTVVEPRYLAPLLPVLLSWTSDGLIEFEDWAAGTLSQIGMAVQQRARIRIALVALVVLILAPSIAAPVRRSRWEELPFEQKEAGLWIRGHSRSSPLIMASGPWAAYYANGRHIYLPDEPYAKVLEYAKGKRVDYVIVASRCLMNVPCIKDTRLSSLLDETRVPPDLELVYEDQKMPEYRALVYRLRDHRTTE